MNWQNIIGNSQTITHLKVLIAEKTMPHALLFVGSEGIGKFLTATKTAAALFCEGEQKPCGRCKACEQLLAKNHPDLFVLEPDGQTIKIEQVRTLQSNIALAPYMANQRVVIIDKADSMTLQSANSLLKTLEEPTGNVVFILIAVSRQKLLDTILSRCMVIDFKPIDREVLAEALVEKEIEPAVAKVIARLAEGSFGKALRLLEQDGLQMRDRALRVLEQLGSCDMDVVWRESSELSELDRTKLFEVLLDLNLLFRDILIMHSDGSSELIYNIDIAAELASQIEHWSVRKLICAMGELANTQQMLKANVNAKLAVEQLFIKLRDL
jgi:DNA polymerase III subunit delta'